MADDLDMSMNAQFLEIAPKALARIEKDASLTERIFQPISPESMAMLDSAFNRLSDRVRQGETLPAEVQEGMAGFKMMAARMQARAERSPVQPLRSLDLGKLWHGLHYLLSGQVMPVRNESPAGEAVLGGEAIGEDFTGYGGARVFNPDRVVEISEALSRPDLNDEMKSRFDPARMTELKVYPSKWSDDDGQRLLDACGRLRNFYAEAAARRSAVLTCLT